MKAKKFSREKRIAYHEAGHVVMCYILRKRFGYVTIKKGDLNEDRLGFMHRKQGDHFYQEAEDGNNRTEIEKSIKISLAGEVAEALLIGRHNWIGARTDIHSAFDLAQRIYGAGETTNAYVTFLWWQVRDQLRHPLNKLYLETVAKALLKNKRLGYRKVRAIIKEAKDELFRDRNQIVILNRKAVKK